MLEQLVTSQELHDACRMHFGVTFEELARSPRTLLSNVHINQDLIRSVAVAGASILYVFRNIGHRAIVAHMQHALYSALQSVLDAEDSRLGSYRRELAVGLMELNDSFIETYDAGSRGCVAMSLLVGLDAALLRSSARFRAATEYGWNDLIDVMRAASNCGPVDLSLAERLWEASVLAIGERGRVDPFLSVFCVSDYCDWLRETKWYEVREYDDVHSLPSLSSCMVLRHTTPAVRRQLADALLGA